MIARVAVGLPIDRIFDYAVPAPLREHVRPGRRVIVPLHGRRESGIVIETETMSGEDHGLESVISVDSGPAFSPDALTFCQELCDLYLAPVGIVADRALPRRVGRTTDRALALCDELPAVFEYLERAERRAPRQAGLLRRLLTAVGPVWESLLRSEMGSIRAAADRLIELGLVREATAARPFAADPAGGGFAAERVLLRGEGRYDHYASEIRDALTAGGQALVLSPNALAAAALQAELERRLPVAGVLYHGGAGDGERGAVWEGCRSGEVRFVVGTRPAVFLPLHRPILAIVDEEQDPAHKQSEMLPYFHARTAALRLGHRVVLGSAAPAVETFHAAATGAIREVRLGTTGDRTWEIVERRDLAVPLTERVEAEIERTLAGGGRALLAVARTGYFRAVICRDCGRAVRCRRCGTALGYRPEAARGVCPTCGETGNLRCTVCGGVAVRFAGEGIERVVETLARRFPRARIARIEGRTIRSRRGRESAMSALDGEADLIVGTQILACGPPLRDVRLAAVLDLEGWTNAPDFRAEERALQWVTGLAARLETGRVVVQTRRPDREILSDLRLGDLAAFYERELADRAAFGYPPFRVLARVTVTRADRAKRRADEIAVRRVLEQAPVDVLGPTPHPRSGGRSILLVKARNAADLANACRSLRESGVPVTIDVDPERL